MWRRSPHGARPASSCRAAPPRCTGRGRLVVGGGPASVYEAGAPQIDPAILELGVPVLGICYGHQLMARALGGEVGATGQREYGRTALHTSPPSLLLEDLPATDTVWM